MYVEANTAEVFGVGPSIARRDESFSYVPWMCLSAYRIGVGGLGGKLRSGELLQALFLFSMYVCSMMHVQLQILLVQAESMASSALLV